MKRVLFVDDEPSVLDGLRNMLRKQRKHWDMVFAEGSPAALAEIAKAPFDVVVSDMRMPGMDGAELLGRIKDLYPATARIVLSGHADREAIQRTISVAHQFLSKPCEAETLRVVVERTCELQGILQDPKLRSVVGKIDKLPSAPRVYGELNDLMAKPDTGLLDIAKVVEKDPAMSVKVLQLVNSAYFGLARRLASVQEAVSYLGLDLIRGLALTAHIFGDAASTVVAGFSMDELQRSSLLTARIGKALVKDPKVGAEVFTACLVHDVGQIILAQGLPEEFGRAVRMSLESGRALHAVEQEVFGVTHAEVGAYLMGVWGLPFPIVEAVAFHHHPERVTQIGFGVLAAVHVADALVDQIGDAAPAREQLSTGYLEGLGVADKILEWKALASRELKAVEERT